MATTTDCTNNSSDILPRGLNNAGLNRLGRMFGWYYTALLEWTLGCYELASDIVSLLVGGQILSRGARLLIKKDNDDKAAYELAFEQIDKDEAWRTIEECFEETHDEKMVEVNESGDHSFSLQLVTRAS